MYDVTTLTQQTMALITNTTTTEKQTTQQHSPRSLPQATTNKEGTGHTKLMLVVYLATSLIRHEYRRGSQHTLYRHLSLALGFITTVLEVPRPPPALHTQAPPCPYLV